jgi:ATP-dependent protease ClpP protease subunit
MRDQNILSNEKLKTSETDYKESNFPSRSTEKKSTENTQVDAGDAVICINANKILFYGQVSSNSCFHLQTALTMLAEKLTIQKLIYGSEPIIHLHLQSPGGELLPSFYIADFIKSLNVPVYTYIDSFAASAATIISVVGKKRFMSQNSLVLIHQLSTQMTGKYNELGVEMNNLNTIMNLVKNIYLENTLIPENKLNALLLSDVWLNSTVALDLGIVDSII